MLEYNTKRLSKNEYFEGNCSKAAIKRKSIIKALGSISLFIQSVFTVVIIMCFGFFMIFFGLFDFSVGIKKSILIIFLMSLFLSGSSCCTVFGLKKNSNAFFIGSLLFSFFTTVLGLRSWEWLSFTNITVIIVLACIVVAINTIMVALNYINIREYKKYILLY